MRLLEKYRFLIYLTAVIPLFILRDFTPDNELRYLSIADEAIRNGNLFTFTNHGIPYADKPPLYLWIVMAGKLLFGHHSMFFLALFSYLPALITIYVMDKWTSKYVNRQALIAGELMLLTSVYFMGAGVVARMDMLMCMFITLSLYVFYRMYMGDGKKFDGLLFPLLVFMAIFSKGPIGILVPFVSTVTFLLLRKDYKAIGRFWGIKTLSVLLVLCLVWFSMVWTEGGKEYLNNLLFNQTVNRAVNSFHHKEPFYYYFVSILYSLFPWSILVISMIIRGISKRTKIDEGLSDTLEQFFIIVALSTFILLSLISSKLQIYLLPAFPFFIYLTLLWLPKFGATGFGPSRFVKISLEIPAFLLTLVTPAYFIYIMSSNRPETYTVTPPASILIPTALTIVSTAGILSLYILHSNKMQIYKVISTLGAGILLSVFIASFAVPQLNPFIGMGTLCKEAKEVAEKEGISNFVYYRLKQADNLDVYLGTQLQELSLEELKNIVDKRMSEEKEDPSRQIGGRSILFVKQSHMLEKDKEAATLLEKYEKHPVGKYFYIIL